MTEQSLKNYKNWLIQLSTIDSTNNYAMKLINDGLAEHGHVVWTKHQSAGKGQRGKVWIDAPDESILMSLILTENLDNISIFELNKCITVSIAQILQSLLITHDVRIKWPNDIYIYDKKTCGILIENGYKGSRWSHAVVGIGINVSQSEFSAELPLATSLYLESEQTFDLLPIISKIRNSILKSIHESAAEVDLIYQSMLYKRQQIISYKDLNSGNTYQGKVVGVDMQGKILIDYENEIKAYKNGEIEWIHK